MIPLNADTIEGFSNRFLIDSYDERVATPDIHRTWWRMVTGNNKYVALAAPRKHAKSTALNFCYGLAASLFQVHPFQLKVCKTYELACDELIKVRTVLTENEAIRQQFHIGNKLLRDRDNDIICEMRIPGEKAYRFRMVAVGMGQAVRGKSFGTVRPTLIQCDDMEDEVEVLDSKNRRATMRWLMKTLIPMGADRCQVRVYGTILHNDSVLSRLLKMKTWKTARYEACDENFTTDSILWPEKFNASKLRDICTMMTESDEDGDGYAGFLMEYRNLAVDTTTSFFRAEDFVPMAEEDWKRPKRFYVGGDLAFSKNQGRDYTVLQLAGLDDEGVLHFMEERRGRWNGKEVIDQMYALNEYAIELNGEGVDEWFIESGAIKETLGTALEIRMRDEGWLNLCPKLIPTQDKAIRATPLQARMRSRGTRWNTNGSWFQAHKQELIEFTQEGTRGAHDDRVDADAWLAQGLKRMVRAESADEREEREFQEDRDAAFEVDAPQTVEFKWTGY